MQKKLWWLHKSIVSFQIIALIWAQMSHIMLTGRLSKEEFKIAVNGLWYHLILPFLVSVISISLLCLLIQCIVCSILHRPRWIGHVCTGNPTDAQSACDLRNLKAKSTPWKLCHVLECSVFTQPHMQQSVVHCVISDTKMNCCQFYYIVENFCSLVISFCLTRFTVF